MFGNNPFASPDSGPPPLDSGEFKETIVSEYAAIADGIGIDECIGAALDAHWPVVTDGDDVCARQSVSDDAVAPTVASADEYDWWPSYRENQRDAAVSVLQQLYVDDKSVVTLSAPTGAGKSLILHGVMAVLDGVYGRDSFFSTPLNALVDQVDDDEFISPHTITLKGKNNYQCVHRQDAGAPVDKAVCQRVSDFECEHKEQHHENGGCPYYGRKYAAQTESEVVTNLAYLMANSMIPEEHGLSNRELVIVDECQKIEDFALNFVGVVISSQTVPVVWDDIADPPQTENLDQLVEWVENEVATHVNRQLELFEAKGDLTEDEASDRDDLQEFARKVQNFVSDVKQNHWTAEHDYEDGKVTFEPIKVGRFLDRFLWSQGQKVVLSSATIPKSGFMDEMGLSNRQFESVEEGLSDSPSTEGEKVGSVEVESTFPPERRGVYTDNAVGKMTWGERDETIPKMAQKIGELANHYEGKRGFIHCHSYNIMERIYDALPADVRERTRKQDGDNREQSLDDWLAADVDERGFGDEEGGQVFLSVGQDEGVSLDYDKCRWQVVAKAAYPHMKSKRVDYRLNELDDWNWYAGTAAISLQQAAGRGMRAKDDWCHTHILDTSAVELIERNEHLFENWFKCAIDVDKTQ
ncbi:helicase [Halorubrum phage GNf2]|nr:helicase [Halorubrum phage GNf2]